MQSITQLKFNSRETYLAYRSAWKTRYQQVSVDIRLARYAIKDWQREGYGGKTLSEKARAQLVEVWRHSGESSLERYRRNLSEMATALLAELKMSKAEAQRQYLARKAALQSGT